MEQLLKEYMLESEFSLIGFEESADVIDIEVSTLEDNNKNIVCPICNNNEHFKKSGHARIRKFKDVRLNGKKVLISIKKQNYRCKNSDCNSVFMEQSPFFYNKVMTTRLRNQIEELILEGTLGNTTIGRITNLDEKSIRRIKSEIMNNEDCLARI